jgi:hypothetical protein
VLKKEGAWCSLTTLLLQLCNVIEGQQAARSEAAASNCLGFPLGQALKKEMKIIGTLIWLFPSPVLELGDGLEVHTVEIEGVQPGDFCVVTVNPFSASGGAVEILEDVVERVAQGPGPHAPSSYAIRHTVTLRKAPGQIVQCHLIGVLIHQL